MILNYEIIESNDNDNLNINNNNQNITIGVEKKGT